MQHPARRRPTAEVGQSIDSRQRAAPWQVAVGVMDETRLPDRQHVFVEHPMDNAVLHGRIDHEPEFLLPHGETAVRSERIGTAAQTVLNDAQIVQRVLGKALDALPASLVPSGLEPAVVKIDERG